MKKHIIVGNVSDDPFSIDMATLCGQEEEIADIISLKTFANSEFCPRFIIQDESAPNGIGNSLAGRTVIICSTAHHLTQTRNALAMRTMIIARSAKENGAKKVILVEPDLFYSAQDRGAHRSKFEDNRTDADLSKFDGQPFSSQLYAQLLRTAGVDVVVTVHNHSPSVQRLFTDVFEGEFYNLHPYEIYADYIRRSDFVQPGQDGSNLILCAPDKGARSFTQEVYDALGLKGVRTITMAKERSGEREVVVTVDPSSECRLSDIAGKDIIVLDDMVRTGSTIIQCGHALAQGNPNRICFGVTHFYSSREGRVTLNDAVLSEILTLNTIPSILNRDSQGRLRKKMVVLKIEKWITRFLLNYLGENDHSLDKDFYTVDMSSKNPRWRPSAIF